MKFPEQFRKSGNRFSDKNCDKQKSAIAKNSRALSVNAALRMNDIIDSTVLRHTLD